MILEERNILSVAFKNVVGTRRAAWRVLSSIQKKENNKGKEKPSCANSFKIWIGNQDNVLKVKEYKGQIEGELTSICKGILQLLDNYLIPNSQSD